MSVIIPAYRAQATLPLVLGALEPQVARRDREVILVDSTGDGHGEVLARLWPWVEVIAVGGRMLPGAARNLGASVARGELLVFCDADAVPAGDWLDNLLRALRPEAEAVAGAILNGTPREPWGTAAYILEFMEWGSDRRAPVEHAASANLLIRRGAFDRAGGFPEDLWPGEDTVFSVPFGTRGTLGFAPGACVTHLNRVGRRDVLAHQRRLGASWVHVCARVPMPGGSLAVPGLAPAAVLARAAYLTLQLWRRQPRLRRIVGLGPHIVACLLAWGLGIIRARG